MCIHSLNVLGLVLFLFLQEAKGLENPYESGVKIKSLPLAVQVISLLPEHL